MSQARTIPPAAVDATPVDATAVDATDETGEPTSFGEYKGFEVYPMPFFVTLTVDDPAAVAAWYEAALGFGTMFAGPVIHLRRRKYQDILLVAGDVGASSASLRLNFQAQGEVEELAARAKAADPVGQSHVDDVAKTPWNAIELRVTDPVGNQLVFTERDPDADPENVERWRKLFEETR